MFEDVRSSKGHWRMVVYPVAIVAIVYAVWQYRSDAPSPPLTTKRQPVVLPTPQAVWWQPDTLADAGTAYPLEPIEVRALYDLLEASLRLPGGAAHGQARGVIWVQSVQARHRIEIYPPGTGAYVIGDSDFEDFPEADVHGLLDRVQTRREAVPLPPETPVAPPEMRPAETADSVPVE